MRACVEFQIVAELMAGRVEFPRSTYTRAISLYCNEDCAVGTWPVSTIFTLAGGGSDRLTLTSDTTGCVASWSAWVTYE
jgi:hypothetical protein